MQRELVRCEIDAFLLLELCRKEFNDRRIKIFAAKECITVGRFDFEHTVTDFENRDVKRTAAKVIHRDQFAVILLKPVGECGSCWLIDNTQHFKASNLSGILGCLTLGIVEICRNRNHGLRHGFTKIALGGFLHLLQSERADLRRRIIFAACFDPSIAGLTLGDGVGDEAHIFLCHRIIETTANQALYRKDRIFRISDGLPLGRLTDEALTVFGKGYDRRGCPRAFGIFNHLGLAALHHCNA